MTAKNMYQLWKGKLGKPTFFLLVIPIWILTLGIFRIVVSFKNHRIVLPLNPLWGKIAEAILKRMATP